MIVLFILNFIGFFLSALLSPLPTVTTLPFGVDVYLADGIGYFNFIATQFPPLATMYSAFMWLLGFKISLLVLRFFGILK